MKVLIDAMGGDNPDAVYEGALMATQEIEVEDCEIVLVGNRLYLRRKFGPCGHMDILDAEYGIGMSDDPMLVLDKEDSTIAAGMKFLRDNRADGFISAGNSGALAIGATSIAKRIDGIKRCAFAPVVPSLDGRFMLIDGGANVECRPQMLYQFGLMGSIYMRDVLGIKNPRVGLVNNGTESVKGDTLRKQAYKLLKNSKLNFIGNIEARDVPMGCADVVVTDGFTGNIILKMYEGTAKMVSQKFKNIFKSNIFTQMASVVMLPKIWKMKRSMDPHKNGGAPILGCSKAVFKAHGNADAKTIRNAVYLICDYIENDVIGKISRGLADFQKENSNGENESVESAGTQ